MTLTEISKAVLFTKEKCRPCEQTKEHIASINPGYLQHLVVLKKENHSALVAAYELDKYPTLLLVNSLGEEVERYVGGQLIRSKLSQILNDIYYNE